MKALDSCPRQQSDLLQSVVHGRDALTSTLGTVEPGSDTEQMPGVDTRLLAK
jgi:hypothetical protein